MWPGPPACFFHLRLPSSHISPSEQLTFGRFGQVVEKKKSITLQDISAVWRYFLCLSNISTSSVYPSIALMFTLSQFSVSLPCRRNVGSCLTCWAARSSPCFVFQWPAGPLARWWRWHAPLTRKAGRGTKEKSVYLIPFM